jgi:diaminopimelate decarboxylase
MHDFRYKDSRFYCENANVENLARRFGTPLYVYSSHTLVDHYNKLKNAFSGVDTLICYSVKANSNLSILKMLVNQGAGFDIVSGGELFRALKAGCPPRKIVYASVGKTDKEIEDAIRIGILFFNVESLPELENINRIAKRLNRVARVAIRLNPDVEARTHRFITTGKITNKFGIDLNSARRILLLRRNFSNVYISGLHIHIGSQITDSAPFVSAIKKVSGFIAGLSARGIGLEYLNIGGGLGIVYDDERPQTAMRYARRVLPILRKTRLKIILEPGRFIVGNAGILVSRILYVKATPKKRFVIVDAGMNDLVRPALYDAYHTIVPLKAAKGARQTVDIVGPICESADFFAKDRRMPVLKEGDYIAVLGAGAYGFSMSSNYNSRLRPAEVMVFGGRAAVIRKRDNFEDLIRNEVLGT